MNYRQARSLMIVVGAVLCSLALAKPAAAQSAYYVDSSGGSDANDGLAPERAWQSLGKVNGVRLKAGDSVLFRRGGTWTGQVVLKTSGRPGRPVTIAAYGTGERPILSGGQVGIDGNGQSHIVIRDLQFRGTTGPAIRSRGSADWRIDHVNIDGSGLGHDGRNLDFSGIQFWNSRDLVIENSTLSNVHGDGIWGWEVERLKIRKNRVEVCQGGDADNVHLYAPRDFEIRDNYFSMEGDTESGKGNLHSQAGTNGLIEGNELRGGNYGVGMTDDNLIVRNNRFFNHDKAKWSAAIIVSEVYDVKNNSFVDNSIVKANMGIYILNLRGTYFRENFQIRDNVFESIRRAAMVVEAPISGEFTGNVLRNSPGASIINRNGRLIRGQRWDERANVAVGSGPQYPVRSGQPR